MECRFRKTELLRVIATGIATWALLTIRDDNANAPIYVPIPPTNLKAVAWHRRQKLFGHKKDRRVFPLLIPPVFEKATQISGHLGEIWDSAQESLLKTLAHWIAADIKDL